VQLPQFVQNPQHEGILGEVEPAPNPHAVVQLPVFQGVTP
jgi:hypothetical protein